MHKKIEEKLKKAEEAAAQAAETANEEAPVKDVPAKEEKKGDE